MHSVSSVLWNHPCYLSSCKHRCSGCVHASVHSMHQELHRLLCLCTDLNNAGLWISGCQYVWTLAAWTFLAFGSQETDSAQRELEACKKSWLRGKGEKWRENASGGSPSACSTADGGKLWDSSSLRHSISPETIKGREEGKKREFKRIVVPLFYSCHLSSKLIAKCLVKQSWPISSKNGSALRACVNQTSEEWWGSRRGGETAIRLGSIPSMHLRSGKKERKGKKSAAKPIQGDAAPLRWVGSCWGRL